VDSVLELARWQFGITTVYHFFFVPLTIGLSFLVALMETIWLVSKRQEWLRLTKFFAKLFLINIAMGVVTGIVQEFQFGMNWSDYSRFVGDVFGAPLAVEALLAFFLESTFIGLWIFGWDKLPRGLHAACMWIVHLGTLASSWFILAANSWMQHPVGYRYDPDSGRAELTSFADLMFNKVQLGTFPHVIGAAYMTGAAFVVGVSAWLYVRGKREDQPLHRTSIRLGAWVLFAAGIVVAITGDVQGKIMTEVQPMKMAAAEALWESSDGCAPFSVFTIGTRDGTEKKWALEVPCVLSFLATGHFDRPVQGIDELREHYREEFGQDPGARYYTPQEFVPIIPVTYWSFRWMMGLGVAGAAGAALILWLTRKGRTPAGRWFPKLAISVPIMVLLGNSMGWIFTEMGRQPWVVYGLMTTRNAVSPGVSATEVWISLIGFTLVYLVLAIVEVGLLVRFVKRGPDDFVEPPQPKWRQDRDDPDAADRPLDFAY
jgi:cytochrome d ubiquinol oxidase subunit I